MTTRRTFLAHGSMALAGAGLLRPHAVPRVARAVTAPHAAPLDARILINEPDVRALALRAIDAAKAAGATYADVHLVRQLFEQFQGASWLSAAENISVGVRALVNGYWGFAASPYWTPDEMSTLATDAVRQAKIYSEIGAPNSVDMSHVPVATGTWSTPIRFDPFTLPIEEKCDYLTAMQSLAFRPDRRRSSTFDVYFTRQERAVATTEGSYFTQTLYESFGNYEVYASGMISREQRHGLAAATNLGLQGTGWELLLDANIPDQIPGLIAAAEEDMLGHPMTPGDIGKYDIVVDATTMAAITAATLGYATQLDRALGYEANARGTSYLGPDPMTFLGTEITAPMISLTANRSMAKGLATVKWDEEGVLPPEFPLIHAGTLVDYQTTREQAAWLAPWYQKRNVTPQSHGCCNIDTALSIPMQHSPNLVLEPGQHDLSFEELVASTQKGMAISTGGAETDFQGRNGFIRGHIREIVNGRLGKQITSIKPLFNAPEFWKSVTAIGGSKSAEHISASDGKGEPAQSSNYTVRAVPATVTKIPFVNASV